MADPQTFRFEQALQEAREQAQLRPPQPIERDGCRPSYAQECFEELILAANIAGTLARERAVVGELTLVEILPDGSSLGRLKSWLGDPCFVNRTLVDGWGLTGGISPQYDGANKDLDIVSGNAGIALGRNGLLYRHSGSKPTPTTLEITDLVKASDGGLVPGVSHAENFTQSLHVLRRLADFVVEHS